jgi:hypothetical protein
VAADGLGAAFGAFEVTEVAGYEFGERPRRGGGDGVGRSPHLGSEPLQGAVGLGLGAVVGAVDAPVVARSSRPAYTVSFQTDLALRASATG